ncbi:MAG: type I-U CRISPR-associated protein Csx17, partial [Dehalococcoidia bacterium]
MNELVLTACRPDPIGSYLKSLGILRLVSEQADSRARGRWSPAGVFVLSTQLDLDQLESFFLDDYRPTPLVAPWNSGSGFRVGGKSPDAERSLKAIEESSLPRLETFRRAIAIGRTIVEQGERLDWGDSKGKEFWSKQGKQQVLRLCRALLPDEAIAWLDACVVLTASEKYSPLLGGSGGVFGRMELSVNYMKRLVDVFALGEGRRAPTRAHSEAWLRATLLDNRPARLLAEPAGQFDPGETSIEAVNPWTYVLTLEGTLLFVSATARRLGSASEGWATLPFMVSATPTGYGTSAADESGKGELWAPLWERPAGLAEIARMIAEGRADWRGRQARDGLDFLEAAASLGVDRGIASFQRHVFVERNGQSLLAVPAGRFPVRQIPQAGLLADVDAWMDRVRRAPKPPAAVRVGISRTEAAVFDLVRSGSQDAAQRLQNVLAELALLELAIGRSPKFRDDHHLPPIGRFKAGEWLAEIDDGSPEMRLAAACAAAHDDDGRCLRWLLRPIGPVDTRGPDKLRGARPEWTESPAIVPGLANGHLVDVMARALVRRAIEPGGNLLFSSDTPPVEQSDGPGRLAFSRQPVQADVTDLARFVADRLD